MPGIEDTERSGRVLVRMPISLHDYLVARARAECVSLSMRCAWRRGGDHGTERW